MNRAVKKNEFDFETRMKTLLALIIASVIPATAIADSELLREVLLGVKSPVRADTAHPCQIFLDLAIRPQTSSMMRSGDVIALPQATLFHVFSKCVWPFSLSKIGPT